MIYASSAHNCYESTVKYQLMKQPLKVYINMEQEQKLTLDNAIY